MTHDAINNCAAGIVALGDERPANHARPMCHDAQPHAVMHRQGIETPKDEPLAQARFRKGCDLGYREACEALEPAHGDVLIIDLVTFNSQDKDLNAAKARIRSHDDFTLWHLFRTIKVAQGGWRSRRA